MIEFEEPTRFTVCPAYMPGETGQSYLGRLTGFFGCPTPKEFCKDFMLDLQAIQHGEPVALRRLASMTGADADALVRCTPRRIDKHFMELGGEIIHTGINSRHRIAICPLCAKEDIAANPGAPLDQAVYGRREWVLAVVDRCRHHDVLLATHQAPSGTVEKLDIVYQSGFLLEELDRLPVERAVLDDFQRYVLSRIGVIEPIASPLLDCLPLVTVTQICHAAGLDLLQRRGHAGVPSDNERRASGFEMLGHGKEGLERTIAEMRQGMVPGEMASRIMTRLLEYMHEAQAIQRNLGELPDILVEIVFRLLPYGPGQILLGRECREFTVYEFLDARRVYGILASQLHAFIEGSPEIAVQVGPGKDNVLIDRTVADRLLLGRAPFITGGDLLRRLGRARGHARRVLGDLVNVGVIQPEAGASRGWMPPLYSQPATDLALAAFVDRFEQVDPAAPGMLALDDITSSYGVTSEDLWKLLASGDIKRMGMIPELGFIGGMRFETAEIVAAMAGVTTAMLVTDVANLFEVPQASVRNLVANHYLARAPGRTGFSTRLVLVFDRTVVEAFHTEFISARALAKRAGSQFQVGVLVGRGLMPAISLDGISESEARTTFYRRVEADLLLA